MRILWLACAAFIAAAPHSVSTAQDHVAHDSATQTEVDARLDHCAMGHMPPERCPPNSEQTDDQRIDRGSMDHDVMDQSIMDHGSMDHGQHATVPEKTASEAALSAAPESGVPERAFDGPRHAADAIWGVSAMAQSREVLRRDHGTMLTGTVIVERLESRLGDGEDAYLWDMQGWYGGDINRFVLKSEGEGAFGGALEEAEIQALYSRAIGPFFDLQAGARFDPEPDTRGHLVIGVQGLAPYMFHVDGAVFLSDRGDLTARLEGEYDQRITQRLIAQPRLELELAAQDIADRGIGDGLTTIELGLRMRYEIAREFAPYVGIEYEAAVGETADMARAAGEDTDGLKVLIGLRTWF